MDAYSWFRQKREGRRFARPGAAHADVDIPLDPTPTVGLLVYCRIEGDIPRAPELLRLAEPYLDQYLADPLLSGVRDFLAQGFVEPRAVERDETDEPPDELIRAYNPGETEERRFRNASHVIYVGTADLLAPPRIGLWAITAVARGLASALPGGVLLDPEFPRLLPLSLLSANVPPDGMVHVAEHILIPYSADPRTGRLWMTTKGMERFGLPDLEVRDVPPNLANALTPVINGLAQRLAEAAMNRIGEMTESMEDSGETSGDELPRTLLLPAEFDFSVAQVRRAYPKDDEPEDEESAESGASRVRLEVSNSRKTEEAPMIRLVPPAGVERVSPGVWLNSLLTELLGSDPHLAVVERGDAQMEEAHQQAVAELGRVKNRFQAGFRFGEVLHVKYGFPTVGDGHEYMWVAVTQWGDDGTIRGHLANEPQHRDDLKQGQRVEVPEDDVYDWMLVRTDGTREGGYTDRLLEEGIDEPEDE